MELKIKLVDYQGNDVNATETANVLCEFAKKGLLPRKGDCLWIHENDFDKLENDFKKGETRFDVLDSDMFVVDFLVFKTYDDKNLNISIYQSNEE